MKKNTKNLTYTFIANFLSLAISASLILIVPKYVDISDYAYWQLYLFYLTYISYMSLGVTDGAYLRYGGFEYKNLPKKVFVSQFWFLVIFDIIIYLIFILSFGLLSNNPNKEIVLFLTCLAGLMVVPRSLIMLILQATGRIKEYSISIIIERLIFFIVTIVILMTSFKDFYFLILADIFGKVFSIIYCILVCRNIVFGKFASTRESLNEIWINILVGSKLLFANLSSVLILGIIRLSIEKKWGIEIFGKISLTLSISTMLLTFINAIAVVLFPALRRTPEKNLSSIYTKMRQLLMISLLGVLMLYFPLVYVLSNWLPAYSDSLIYMSILFPICVFESKNIMLISTYLKTMRKEKVMLKINFITLIVSMIITYGSVFVLVNINLAIYSIIFVFAFRSIVSEIYLGGILNINVKLDIFIEVMLTIVFIISCWYFNLVQGLILYLAFYIFFLYSKKTIILKILKYMKLK
ncbi:hypothetical protein [Peribacillus sp. NPDC097225]|uniref:hypothetical protein n=1 Tax=Peribacillus sp. NPDC097225 TaxID=3364400 RepID=UPI00380E761E